MDARCWARIDLSALRRNLETARAAAPRSRVICVIKADGYGHGLLAAARALEAGADAFAVATLDEALTLRRAGIGLPLLLLSAFWRREQVAALESHRISPVVNSPTQVSWLERRGGTAMDIWLKIDTGMHRLGVAPEAARPLYDRLRRATRGGRVRLMTHFANADDPADDYTLRQLRCFGAATAGIEAERSLANSAGILGWPASHAEWIRPGIMLYGASPLRGCTAESLGLEPVMHLESRLVAVHDLAAGEPLGYGGVWRAPAATRIGVVGCGYGDGYPRVVGEGASVGLRGRRAPIVGRVSMDMITVNLRHHPDAAVGDTVQLWGEAVPVDEVAGWAGTIAYELTCQVTPRALRFPVAGDGSSSGEEIGP